MTEYTTLSDGKTHRVTDKGYTSVAGHFQQTACGLHVHERQDNVDVYETEEAPEVDDLCANCDRAGTDRPLPPCLKAGGPDII